jgi:transcriptional regulator with XRE-family HTH domain
VENWLVRNTPPFFATRLQALREKAGLSQYALAKLSGLSKQALSSLELGLREPNWNTVQRLAAALGVSCDDFMDPALTRLVPAVSRRRKETQLAPSPPPKRPRSRPRKVDRKQPRATAVEARP